MAMTIKRVSAALIGVVVSGAVLPGAGGAPAQASWDPPDTATSTSQACPETVLRTTQWAVACFVPYGDVLLVFNDSPRQRAAAAALSRGAAAARAAPGRG